MNKVKKNAIRLGKIIGSAPTIFINFKKHYELYKILKYYRLKNLIKFRTYGIYMFSYLSKQLSAKEKLLILLHHYTFIKESFENLILKKIFTDGISCWEENNGTNNFKILLMASHYLEFEGSVTLLFTVDDSQVFNLNFSFAPGEIFGYKNEKTVLFLSGLKGVKNECSNIELVLETYSEMSPRIILMKVLETISICMGINTIIAINATSQVAFGHSDNLDSFYRNYDNFWESLMGEKLVQGYYRFTFPLAEKPIQSIKHRYKKRAIERRSKLKDIAMNSQFCFSNHIVNTKRRDMLLQNQEQILIK